MIIIMLSVVISLAISLARKITVLMKIEAQGERIHQLEREVDERMALLEKLKNEDLQLQEKPKRMMLADDGELLEIVEEDEQGEQ